MGADIRTLPRPEGGLSGPQQRANSSWPRGHPVRWLEGRAPLRTGKSALRHGELFEWQIQHSSVGLLPDIPPGCWQIPLTLG